MALEHIIKHSCRFNIKNPQHRKVNEVLVNLSPDVCKSKSQFLINAAEYYIDHFGKEAFIESSKDDSPYVRKSELKAIEERTIAAAVTEARNEVIRHLGGLLSGAVTLPTIKQANTTDKEPEELKEEPEDDETVTDYALSYSYEVVDFFVVGPYDNSIKTQSDTEELTLFTCAERGTKRFVVKCVPDGEEGAYGE